ncbi:hypothetical protein V8G54_008171, partial [Vigna mungo]
LDPDRIDLSGNNFVGDASFLIGSKKKIRVFDLSRNAFSFDLSRLTFPKETLTWFDISHNNIYGSIPMALTKVRYFQQLNFSFNPGLKGQIPQGGGLQTFDKYSYFHTNLCGSPLPPCTK